MKIRALRLAEVGIFRDAVAVEDFSGALDVLAGPNELGKSTLFRAIRAVFLTRHTATGRVIEEMATRGGARSPTIEADFEAQGQLWRITKTFGRGKSADLIDLDAGRVRARGADAEEVLAGLIGVAGGEAAAGRFGLLWVGQQQSLQVPAPDYDTEQRKFSGRVERATLEGAIASEIDTVTGGALVRQVADRAAAELAGYLQPKRGLPKKGSRHELALQKRTALAAQLEHARAEHEKAVARLSRLEDLTRRQAAEASPELLARLHRANEDAVQAFVQAEKLANGLAQALAREETARLSHEQAADRLNRYGLALDDAAACATERVGLDEDEARHVALRTERQNELSIIEEQIVALTSRIMQLGQEAERLRKVEMLSQSIADKEASLARAYAIEEDIVRINAELAENPATPERMRHLAEAVQAAVLAKERAAQPAAVDIAFALADTAVGRVRINGAPVSGTERIGVDDTVVIEIEGVGRFEIIPRDATERALRRVAAEEAQVRLAKVEAELGVSAGEAAQVLADERQALADTLLGTKAQRASVAPAGVGALEAALAVDRQALAMVEDAALAVGMVGSTAGSDLATAGSDLARSDVTDVNRSLTEEVGALRLQRDAALDEVRAHDFALQRIGERRSELTTRLASCDAVLGPAAGRLAERNRLAALGDAAAAAMKVARQERMLLSQSAPSAEQVEALRSGQTAAERTLRQAEAAGGRFAQEIAALEGEVRAAGEAEIGPEIARLEGEIAALDAEIAHHQQEIAALQLLQETLTAVASQNRVRFLLPVMKRLQPYLAQVFAGAEMVLDEDFRLRSFSRGGEGEPIDILSDGTREQLAVLVRLGFGRLIAESGTAAPVILDDALVFSDDQRIVRMFDALKSASQHHQVIVFTCRQTTFAPLGGTRLSITPWAGRS